MPRYRVNLLSFIDNKLVQPGSEVDYEGLVAEHFEPLDKKAEKVSEASLAAQQAELDAKKREGNLSALLSDVIANSSVGGQLSSSNLL